MIESGFVILIALAGGIAVGSGEDCCFTHCSCTWKSNRLVVSLDLFRKVGGNI